MYFCRRVHIQTNKWTPTMICTSTFLQSTRFQKHERYWYVCTKVWAGYKYVCMVDFARHNILSSCWWGFWFCSDENLFIFSVFANKVFHFFFFLKNRSCHTPWGSTSYFFNIIEKSPLLREKWVKPKSKVSFQKIRWWSWSKVSVKQLSR